MLPDFFSVLVTEKKITSYPR